MTTQFAVAVGCALALAGGFSNSSAAQTSFKPRFAARAATCDGTSDWLKSAYAYTQIAPSGNKRPAIYATATVVSLAQADAPAGKAPDHTVVWYAHGEMGRAPMPITSTFSGILPLWLNGGPDNTPFTNTINRTLITSVDFNGKFIFQYQNDGRNFMGKGPQTVQLTALPNKPTDNTLFLTGKFNFAGDKTITLALTKGEATSAATPPASKPVIGTKYRITPDFTMINFMLPKNPTVQAHAEINFSQNGKQLGFFSRSFLKNSAKPVIGDAFDFVVMNSVSGSNNLKVSGSIPDPENGNKGPLWQNDSILVTPANSLGKGPISIGPGATAKGSYGNLHLKVEKIEDVY